MNPELPAEEMKKPSSPVAHSLVSSVQWQTGGSLPESALCLLSTGLSDPTAGATVEGQCGCWCLGADRAASSRKVVLELQNRTERRGPVSAE